MPPTQFSTEQLLQHQSWLFHFVRQFVLDDFTADDVVQTTLANALEHPNKGKVKNWRSWLGGIAKNTILQDRRQHARRRKRESALAIDDKVIVEHSSELTELFHIANQAIHELPAEERIAILLRQMQGYSPAEVAKSMGISVERVYRLTENGIKKLRKRLESCYGKRWREGCLAILGFPPLQKAPSFLTPLLTLAAGLVLLLGAGWLLHNPPAPALEVSGVASADHATTALQPAANSSNVLAPKNPLRAILPVLPPEEPRSFLFAVFTPNQQPVAGATVSLSWRNGTPLDSALLQGSTDNLGQVRLTPTPQASSFTVECQMPGFFFQPQPVDEAAAQQTSSLFLEEGAIPVYFRTNPPRSGEVLVIQTDFNKIGSCVTDELGNAVLLFPEAGHASVVPQNPTPGISSVDFVVDTQGSLEPIEVPLATESSFDVVAVADSSAQPLNDVRFSFCQPIYDEDHRLLYTSIQPLPANQGLLHFENGMAPLQDGYLCLQADGYADTLLHISSALGSLFEVPMPEEELVPATIQATASPRNFISLVLHRQIIPYVVPASSSSKAFSLSFPNSEIPLSVNRAGEFSFPRLIQSREYTFKLEAVDDLGQAWVSPALSARDAQGSALHFELSLPPEGTTTIRMLGALPASFSTSYSLLVENRGNNQSSLVYPQAGETMQIPTYAGETIHLNYSEPHLQIDLEGTLPTESNQGVYEFRMPDRSATLTGQVYAPDGSLLKSGNLLFTYLDPLSFEGPGTTHTAVYFTGQIYNGQFDLPNCFSGRYQLMMFCRGMPVKVEVQSHQPFEVHLPLVDVFSMKIVDAMTHEPLGATLSRARLRAGETRVYLASSSPESGYLSRALTVPSNQENLLLLADGYEPHLVNGLLPDGSLNLVEMVPARFVEIDLTNLAIAYENVDHWNLDLWGNSADPRQTRIHLGAQGLLTIPQAPKSSFTLSAKDSQDQDLSISILVHEDGSYGLL